MSHYKRLYTTLLLVLCTLFNQAQYVQAEDKIEKVTKNMIVTDDDLRNVKEPIALEVLNTLTFDMDTIWPKEDMMPREVTPSEILEHGKDPGLGVRDLNKEGYNGENVKVAVLAGFIDREHEVFKDTHINLIKDYFTGSAPLANDILSVLCGKDIGVAPRVQVDYYLYGSSKNKNVEANIINQIIQRNRVLPQEERVRIIGITDYYRYNQMNEDKYKQAKKNAEQEGIIVVDNDFMDFFTVVSIPLTDRNDPKNYIAPRGGKIFPNYMHIPTSFTTADNNAKNKANNQYLYSNYGKIGNGIAYLMGVIAMGFQIDPTMDDEVITKYLSSSAYPLKKGKLINPRGFVEMVKKNKKNRTSSYYIIAYNSQNINDDDLKAIRRYGYGLKDRNHDIVYVDVKAYKSSTDIYNRLKKENEENTKFLRGIQIFGDTESVPSFSFKGQLDLQDYGMYMTDSIETDYFYSNLSYTPSNLKKALLGLTNNDLLPEWQVSRLPLNEGQIKAYIDKYKMYNKSNVQSKQPLSVILNNSPFDKMLSKSLDSLKQKAVIRQNQYKIYEEGRIEQETIISQLQEANKNHVSNIMISNSCIHDNNTIVETMANGNMDNNYFNMFLIDSLESNGESHYSLLAQDIATGKVVNYIWKPTTIDADTYKLIKNISIDADGLLFNHFIKNLYVHQLSWSESLHIAKVQVLKEIADNSKGSFLIRDSMLYQHIGLIDRTENIKYSNVLTAPINTLKNDVETPDSKSKLKLDSGSTMEDYLQVPIVSLNQKKLVAFQDNDIEFYKVDYYAGETKGNHVRDISVAIDEYNIYVKVKWVISKNTPLTISLQNGKDNLYHYRIPEVNSGDRTLVIKLDKKEIINDRHIFTYLPGADDYFGVNSDILSSLVQLGVTPRLVYNDDYIAFNHKLQIRDGSLTAPAVEFFKGLGYQVQWKNKNMTLIATNEDYKIELTEGSEIKVNGKVVKADYKMKKANGIFVVPIRLIAESIGKSVSWSQDIRTVIIKDPMYGWK